MNMNHYVIINKRENAVVVDLKMVLLVKDEVVLHGFRVVLVVMDLGVVVVEVRAVADGEEDLNFKIEENGKGVFY